VGSPQFSSFPTKRDSIVLAFFPVDDTKGRMEQDDHPGRSIHEMVNSFSQSPSPPTTTTTTISASRRSLQNEVQSPRPSRHTTASRLWQLPESSIQEYASWIREKPSPTQTPAEKRFLHKFQQRRRMMLIRQGEKTTSSSSSMETMKHYIARLEAKKDLLSDVELQLIQAYHRRKAKNRVRKRDNNPFRESTRIPSTITWRRERSSLSSSSSSARTTMPTTATIAAGTSTTSSASLSFTTTTAVIANLQERLNRMGLSSDRLLDISMHVDDDDKESSSAAAVNPKTRHY